MLEKADGRSKARLAQIAPEKLHQRDRRHGRRFGAKNSPAYHNGFETLALGQFCFLRREPAFRSDDDQHRMGVALLLVNLMERSRFLLFPEKQFKSLWPRLIDQLAIFPQRLNFRGARSAALLRRAQSDFLPALGALDG